MTNLLLPAGMLAFFTQILLVILKLFFKNTELYYTRFGFTAQGAVAIIEVVGNILFIITLLLLLL